MRLFLFPSSLVLVLVPWERRVISYALTHSPRNKKTGRRTLAQQGPKIQTRVSAVLQRYMRKCLWSGTEGEGLQQSYSSAEHVPLLALYASFLPGAKERRRVFAEYMEGASCNGGWLSTYHDTQAYHPSSFILSPSTHSGVHASSLRGQCREQALLFMGLHDLGVVVAEVSPTSQSPRTLLTT